MTDPALIARVRARIADAQQWRDFADRPNVAVQIDDLEALVALAEPPDPKPTPGHYVDPYLVAEAEKVIRTQFVGKYISTADAIATVLARAGMLKQPEPDTVPPAPAMESEG